eukprot:jgi/Ulvmu1/4609/UM002_0338.1
MVGHLDTACHPTQSRAHARCRIGAHRPYLAAWIFHRHQWQVSCLSSQNLKCCARGEGSRARSPYKDRPSVQTSSQTALNAVADIRQAVNPPRTEAVCPPLSIHDINNGNILGFGGDLAPDHPGYGDEKYCQRRVDLSKAAKQHVLGQPVPEVHYLPEEQQTWTYSLTKLKEEIPRWACSEYKSAFEMLDFREGTVPQLRDVQKALQLATGWNIRPTAGLMHPRDFLNGLAFKTFHSTQYVRHHSNPAYTPEPDVIHEILGHIPMLLCPKYCEIMDHIGRASLHASDAEIWQLTKVYWYTVEFGVVREGSEVKAFGAGILSSYGELEWMGSGKAQIAPLDLSKPLPKMSYKDGYQKMYFCLDSFESGTRLLKEYAQEMIQQRGT